MKFWKIQKHLPAIAAFAVVILISCAALDAQPRRFNVELRNGSAITVEVNIRLINWTNVHDDGQLTTQRISLDDIQRLVITAQPASEQVANIRRLISDLGSKDYHRREAAEKALSNKKIGGPYQALIERHLNDDVFEVRYRIKRILSELKASNRDSATSATFDRLELKSGEVLEGDAGNLSIQCSYAGRSLELNRKQMVCLVPATAIVSAQQESKPTTVKMFHRDEDFVNDRHTVVDFETSPDGEELTKSTNVNEVFTDLGLRLDIEGNGFVGISGYPFDFDPLPPGGNSVCVFETSGSFPKRFRGIFEISFCVPKHPSIAAGVNEVGLFLARVGHSRDLIMEAYNADGHLLATVEATENPCMFGGVKSNELIAKVRVLSSPHLFRLARKIDEDYAIDNIIFSTPKPLPFDISNEDNLVRMKNGAQLMTEKIDFSNGQIVVDAKLLDSKFEVNLDEVAEIRFANPMKGDTKDWLAMLRDRNIIRVGSAKKLDAIDFDKVELDKQDVVALAAANSVFRYPESEDFDKGSTILVFPTCRILTQEVDLRDYSVRWDKNSVKIEQPLATVGNEAEEDPTPTSNSISFNNPTPTIWFDRPVSADSTLGKLHLTDGQQFTLGGESEFKITRIDKANITIAWNNAQLSVPWDRVRMIKFPEKDN